MTFAWHDRPTAAWELNPAYFIASSEYMKDGVSLHDEQPGMGNPFLCAKLGRTPEEAERQRDEDKPWMLTTIEFIISQREGEHP